MNTGKLILLAPLCLLLSSCNKEPELTTTSRKALEFYSEGVRLQSQFYYSEAIGKFEAAIEEDSTFAMALGRLGALNTELRNEDEASRLLATARRHSAGTTLREQLYIRLWDRMAQYKRAEAARVADSLLVLCPNEAEPYILRGHLYEQTSQLDSAIQLYRKASSIDTSNTRAVMSLGYAYSAAGDQDRAIEYMQRYIRMAPGLADPHASFADLLLRAGRYDEALDQYEQSLEYKPDYWYSLNQIGQIHVILGRLKAGEEFYRKGFAALPPNQMTETAIPVILGELEMKRGNYPAAAELFLQALALDSLSYEAAYGLVLALAKQGDFRNADQVAVKIGEELERRELAGTPQMVGFHLMRARVLVEKKQYQSARGACEEALLLSTPLVRTVVFRQLAEISYRLREIERGFLECEESLSINPNSPSTLLTLARLYDAKGDRQMTMEIGKRLLQLWKHADSDFKDLNELRVLLRMSPGVPS